jgi:hypothetical protein
MATGDATTLLGSQLAAAAACTYIINALQRIKQLPWITAHTKTINVIVRAGLAGIAELGISHAWSPASEGGGVLMITIPPLMVLVHGLWHWFTQYAMTHVIGSALEKTPNVATPSSIEVVKK